MGENIYSILKLCANCKADLRKMISSRKRVTLNWMRSLIWLNNKESNNNNEFLCCKCYFELNNYKFCEHFKQFLDEVESEIPSKEFEIQSIKLQFDAFSEKRCKSLTGFG